MRKITQSSLVATIALATLVNVANANESLSDAFKNGTLKAQIKSIYSDSNFLGNASSDEIVTVGGSLGYVSGDFYGFSGGVTFQTSHIPSEDNNNGVFASDLDAQGSVLSEAYINYTRSNTSFKVGRQFLYTPLVSSAIDGKSSESLVKDSFEAFVLTNTDIPNTTLVMGYVDKYQSKTSSGDIGNFEQFEDGAYTIYAKNTSIANVTLQAQYLKVNATASDSDRDNLYFQADYALAGHTLSVQYLSSADKAQADGELYGLRAMGPLGIEKIGYIVAYNSSTKDGAVDLVAGTGTSDTPFTAMPVNGGGVPARANTDTLVGGLVIPIADITGILYVGESFCDVGLGDVKAAGAIAIYPFYKNFLVKVNYEHVETQNIFTENTDVTRVYLSYTF